MPRNSASVNKVDAAASLRTSQPDPSWFGNAPNEPKNKSWTNKNWLKSIFHFSFAEIHYSEANRNRCGVLRVMNDDLVQPKRGFGEHPHADMEICTYVVNGELTHEDSMGTAETLKRGAIQFMTAGTGVEHSEHNLSTEKPLRFIQMWIVPRKRGLKPNYGSASIPKEDRQGKWSWMVGDAGSTNPGDVPVRINQDCNMFAQEIPAGESSNFVVQAGRQAYILTVETGGTVVTYEGDGDDTKGSFGVNKHDAIEVVGPVTVSFEAKSGVSHILVVEMAA